jgi:hypothetical protein
MMETMESARDATSWYTNEPGMETPSRSNDPTPEMTSRLRSTCSTVGMIRRSSRS